MFLFKKSKLYFFDSLLLFYYLIIIFILLKLNNKSISIVNADDRKTASQLITERGFNVEEFDVITQHTYNLKIYHIINPLADKKTLNKIPVVAHHGVSFDMSNMMAAARNARPRKPKLNEQVTLYTMENGTDDRGLYFYLSNNNYDVWLLEARGTTDRVKRRLKDSRDKKSFWDFSLDEQALIDLPIQIDFVRMKTKQPKVAYIAFSQSTMFMFALLTIEPEFSNKLVTFIAIAPVFFSHHYRGLVWPSTILRLYFGSLSSANPSLPSWLLKLYNFSTTYLCSINLFKNTLCKLIWSLLGGPETKAQMEGGLIENMFKPTSLKAYEQFTHNSLIKDMRMYDYKDELRNIEEYGQPIPPYYNVSNINLKTIVLFRGILDYLGDSQDQLVLLNRLKVPLYEDHILEEYAHMDFISAPTIVRDVNEPILNVLDKLTNRTIFRVLHSLKDESVENTRLPLVVNLNKNINNNNNNNNSNNNFITNANVESKLLNHQQKEHLSSSSSLISSENITATTTTTSTKASLEYNRAKV